MLKIRLRRMGKRHRPFYRVVVSDSREVPGAPAVEEIGHYDPMNRPQVALDLGRIEHWVGQGAQMSPTVKKLVKGVRTGKAEKPAEPAAKKGKKAAAPAPPPVEETPAAPVEEPVEETPAAPAEEAAAPEQAPEAAAQVAAAEPAEAEAAASEPAAAEEAPATEETEGESAEAEERATDQ